MSSISLTSSLPLVFLGSDSFFYQKTGKTYFNVDLYDNVSGSSLRVNTTEDIYKELVLVPRLSSLMCDFDFDINYKNLRLKSFSKFVDQDGKK